MSETHYYMISDSDSEDETNPGNNLSSFALCTSDIEQSESESEYESDLEPEELEKKDLDFKTFEDYGFDEQKYKNCLRCPKIKKVKYFPMTKKSTVKYSANCRQCLNNIARMKTTCGCGSIISKSNETRHKKTKKHKDYIKQL